MHAVKYQENPEYYTMKSFETEDYVIISSEVLPNIIGNWNRIGNDTLIELDIAKRKLVPIELTKK